MLKTKYNAASRPITDCQKYFSRERMPSGSLCTTLRQSSAQPIAPKPKVTISTIQTKRLLRSNQSRVEMPIASNTSTPPMVGVPLLLRCVCNAYSRIGWPIFRLIRRRMTKGPAISPINKAVIAAITARKVRYWNTLK